MGNKKSSFRDKLLRAFKAKDADEVERIAKEAEDAEGDDDDDKRDKKTADAIAALGKSFDAKFKALDEKMDNLEKKVEDAGDDDDDDGEGEGKKNKKPTDDTVINAETGETLSKEGVQLYTGDAAKIIGQRAEILAPGTKIPTFDAKTTDGQRVAALCGCQRKALEQAYSTDAGRELIEPLLNGSTIGKLPLSQLNVAFMAASELMKQRNNAVNSRAQVTTRDFGKPLSVAEINARNAKFWADRRRTN